MNIAKCANCLLHGWNQVEDLTTLQHCKRCKVIQYCGIECQTEHWLNVHKKQCKYFADPVKAQQWDHKEENCGICRQSAVVGKLQLKRPDNPYYECIFEDFKKVPPHLYHPHPFPITGDPGDTYEKAIIVLRQLLEKFQLTQPGVVSNCREELGKVIANLVMIRLSIWKARKISPRLQIQKSEILPVYIKEKVERSEPMADPFKLWKIILLVNMVQNELKMSQDLNGLINPLADMPAEFHAGVTQGVNNSAMFLATTKQVLEALTTQVIPYRDVLAIICGGSLEKMCSFCSKKIIIADETFVLFGCLSTTIYSCERNNCLQKFKSIIEDQNRCRLAILTTVGERLKTQCDFCLKLPPSADVHRCSKCLAVMYCSTECMVQDGAIHKNICKEDVEQRKKKVGGSARRKEARGVLKKLEKEMKDYDLEKYCGVIDKFKLKKSTKKSDK